MTATIDERFLHELESICGSGGIVRERLELLTYECDALPYVREEPAVVVLPGSADQVQQVVRLCAREGVPFVARGHGTGLSGGAVPVPGGVVIGLSRLNRVLDVDIPNRRVTVEPGVTNLEITRQVAPHGYYYAPDPSSQQVCSIGGQRGRELGRRPLPEVRIHGASCAGARCGDARRRARAPRERDFRCTRARSASV